MRRPITRRGVLLRRSARAALPPHAALALGMDVAPAELFATSICLLRRECFPPFLDLAVLSRCWAMWTVLSSTALVAGPQCSSSISGAEESHALAMEALLAAAEDSLGLYCEMGSDREQSVSGRLARCRVGEKREEKAEEVIVCVGKERATRKGTMTTTRRTSHHGYHRIVGIMLQYCGSCLTRKTLVLLLQYAVQVEDSEGAVLTELMRLLASITDMDCVRYEASLRSVLTTSLPVHIAPVVLSILRNKNINANIVKLCLHHVALVVRGRRTGALSAESTMGGFHECAVRAFYWFLGNQIDQYKDVYIQIMSCLKHAPIFLLCEIYSTMKKHNIVTPSIQCKFLANCGIVVTVSNTVPYGCADVIVSAFCSLARSNRETRHIEEGLVHGGAVLVALTRGDLICDAYAARPTLRETPHSVMAHVQNKDVVSSHQALLRLAQSREEGWINIPFPVMHAIHSVCLLVGRSGAAADIKPLYRALVSFHNPGMIVSQCIEYVLAGICDHVSHIGKTVLKDTPPRTVLDHVIPLLRSVMMYIGDEINTDMILELLETSVTLRHLAVPLTSSILWNLQRSSSLSLKELFSRVDSSTNGIPFLNYYTLCYARDQGRKEAVEHLAMVWRCDATPILKRHASLAPLYKLWKCASCGRLNSDRFNYCLCSALRNCFVVCSRCRHAQDERWSYCQSCGERIHEGTIAAAVVRRSWTCDDCGSNNPARQVFSCFRCKSPCGPVAKASASLKSIEMKQCFCPSKELKEEVEKNKKKTSWDGMKQYCRECGWFREKWAAANSVVWCCEGCGELRSSLDNACPNCPHVEYLPFAVVRKKSPHSISCSYCQTQSENPFALRCLHCGELLQAVGTLSEDTEVALTGKDGDTQIASRCSHSGVIVTGNNATNIPCECEEGEMRDINLVHISPRHCERCGKEIDPLHIAGVCLHCVGFLPPVSKEGWSVSVVHETMKVLVQLSELDAMNEKLVNLLQELLYSFQNHMELRVVEETRVMVTVEFGRFQTHLYKFIDYDGMARRAIALTKQIMEFIDTKCGYLGTPHFLPGQCSHCIGTHTEELCVHHTEPWFCGECGAENNNADVCRYACQNCLALRPCVQEMCLTEAWECLQCQRVNAELESFCIFCGVRRAAAESAMEEAVEACPFLPAKCPTCSLVHLEARCPLCHNVVPELMKDVEGVVCMVTSRYAFIQPGGTDHPSQRVYVGEPWLRKRQWINGEKVVFTAKINEHGGFRVTSIQS